MRDEREGSPGRHPLHEQMEWWWEFYRISWAGGDDYLNPTIRTSPVERTTTQTDTGSVDVTSRHRSMLYAFPAEEDGDFVWRLRQARYGNFCAPLLRARLGHVMSGEVRRVTPAEFGPYLADVDGSGLDRDAWMRLSGTQSQAYGHVFVLTEIPSVPTQPRSAAEARSLGQRVYSTIFSPIDVPNWAIDERGALLWIVLRYQPTAESSPFGGQRNVLRRYRVWYRDRWEEWASEGEDQGGPPTFTGLSGPNPIGRVPVDILYNARDVGRYPHPIGLSALTGIAEDNRAHFNFTSLLDQQIYEQTFASLAVPAQSPEMLKKMVVSVKRVIGFHKDGGPPVYVAPPEGPTRILMENIDKLEQRMRAMANLSRGVAEQSIAARSGDALAVEAADKFSDLRTLRAAMQAFR